MVAASCILMLYIVHCCWTSP